MTPCGLHYTRGLAHRQKVEEKQALHIVDTDSAKVFVEQIGDQVEPSDKLAELSLKT